MKRNSELLDLTRAVFYLSCINGHCVTTISDADYVGLFGLTQSERANS